jgi:hypothetical protein
VFGFIERIGILRQSRWNDMSGNTLFVLRQRLQSPTLLLDQRSPASWGREEEEEGKKKRKKRKEAAGKGKK